MSELKPIGGFFELEVPPLGPGYHPNALALTNGRACIRWILEREKPLRIYIPFYTCYALYEPMEKMGIEVIFYSIDEALDPVNLPEPMAGELLVLVNYFGLKNRLADHLDQRFGRRVVIDDTQRFFHRGYQYAFSFTSARKYFGVPDGAYLYGADREGQKIDRNMDISVSHNIKRLSGNQSEAYRDYLNYEESLGDELKMMSLFSEHLLSGVDYEAVAQRRISNFNFLHEGLKRYNNLTIIPTETEVPFSYPFLPDCTFDKVYFHKHKIYIPTLWPDVLERDIDGFEQEKDIAQRLLPLPIDQRYAREDMERIVNFITGMMQ